jgi:hypothetical protein
MVFMAVGGWHGVSEGTQRGGDGVCFGNIGGMMGVMGWGHVMSIVYALCTLL